MKASIKLLIVLSSVSFSLLASIAPASAAQAVLPSKQIVFNSFTGVYHLSRDSRGLSLLTTGETIVADFPASGFSGIKRVIPEKFIDHSVEINILNVSDAAGNPVPYRTSSDNNNLTLTTGDPAIILSGKQTIRIEYQTSGVVSFTQKSNELLLDVNGRGWNQSFNQVTATIYVPSSFNSNLQSAPSCYLALGTTKTDNCQTSVQSSTQGTVISSKATAVDAHQSLIIKLDFSPTTFTNHRGTSGLQVLLLTIITLLIAGLLYLYKRSLTSHKK